MFSSSPGKASALPAEALFEGKHISSLGRFRDLLNALSHDDADGRVVCQA
jgi:hypothetical protein